MKIKTILPLSMETLKLIITSPEDVEVEIDYANSKLRGRAALIYLTNANVPNPTFNIENVPKEQIYELVDAYVTQKSTINIENLVATVLQILFFQKAITSITVYDSDYFNQYSLLSVLDVAEYLSNDVRKKNIKQLIDVLDNIPLFVFTCNTSFEATFGNPKTVFKTIDNIDYTGFTFVNLINHQVFQYNYYTVPADGDMCYFVQQYEQPLFNGRSLFGLLNQENNSILGIFNAIMMGEVTIDNLALVNQSIDNINQTTNENIEQR